MSVSLGFGIWKPHDSKPGTRICTRGGATKQMAESTEHTEEDLIPIQNFMRRFSHADDADDQEPSSQSLVVAAAAEAAKQPTRNTTPVSPCHSSVWKKFKGLFVWESPAPPREPTTHDWLLLPFLKAKAWLVGHPKITTAVCVLLLSTVADKFLFYDQFHRWVCWCMEDDACVVGFILKLGKFLKLCT